MSNIPAELRYSEDHEWISTSAPWKIGVSDYAQNALGDLTYVELPSVGDTFEKGQEFGTLESTKSVSPLFMPVAGTIKAVNEALVDAPEKVNQDPYGEGWLIEIESAEGVSELLDAAAYKAHLETLQCIVISPTPRKTKRRCSASSAPTGWRTFLPPSRRIAATKARFL